MELRIFLLAGMTTLCLLLMGTQNTVNMDTESTMNMDMENMEKPKSLLNTKHPINCTLRGS